MFLNQSSDCENLIDIFLSEVRRYRGNRRVRRRLQDVA